MSKSKKKEQLMAILDERGECTIQEAAQHLGVSASTIRRYAAELVSGQQCLHARGKLKSYREPAIIRHADEPCWNQKRNHCCQEKEELARAAAQSVKDGDCIFLDSGTTTAMVYPFISGKDVLVVTNNLWILDMMRKSDRARVVFSGGDVDIKYSEMAGPMVLEIIRRFAWDKSFLSCIGLDRDRKICTCSSLQDGLLKRTVIDNARESVLLADSSKTGRQGQFTFAGFPELDHILVYEEGEVKDWKAA